MNLLVVEDHQLLRDILVKNLTDENYQVYAFESAEAMLAEEERLHPIDVAILDITLPGMNGLELSTRLRQSYPSLIIIILTMHNELDSKFKSFEAGANLYLTKPVNPKQLSQAIKHLNQWPNQTIAGNADITLDSVKLKIYTQNHTEKLTFKKPEYFLC